MNEFAIVQARQPSNSEVLAATAYVQRRQGKWAEALANLLKALGLDPRSNTISFEVSKTSWLTRNYPEAERYLDRALMLAPEWPGPYSLKARLYLGWSGDTARAERVLREALGKTDPGRFVAS